MFERMGVLLSVQKIVVMLVDLIFRGISKFAEKVDGPHIIGYILSPVIGYGYGHIIGSIGMESLELAKDPRLSSPLTAALLAALLRPLA